jgi:hypothetical protein
MVIVIIYYFVCLDTCMSLYNIHTRTRMHTCMKCRVLLYSELQIALAYVAILGGSENTKILTNVVAVAAEHVKAQIVKSVQTRFDTLDQNVTGYLFCRHVSMQS